MRNTLLKPILSLSVLMGASGCFTQGYAEDIVIVDGLWKISSSNLNTTVYQLITNIRKR